MAVPKLLQAAAKAIDNETHKQPRSFMGNLDASPSEIAGKLAISVACHIDYYITKKDDRVVSVVISFVILQNGILCKLKDEEAQLASTRGNNRKSSQLI